MTGKSESKSLIVKILDWSLDGNIAWINDKFLISNFNLMFKNVSYSRHAGHRMPLIEIFSRCRHSSAVEE